MNKYICGILLILCMGCKSAEVKSDIETVDKKSNVYKSTLFYIWVVTGGM